MSNFRTLSSKEALEFLRLQGKRVTRVHALTEKICHWPYCKHCGLVALKNDPTRKALKGPCLSEE